MSKRGMKTSVSGVYRKKKRKLKRNKRNGMEKKAAMDSLAKSMNRGYGGY